MLSVIFLVENDVAAKQSQQQNNFVKGNQGSVNIQQKNLKNADDKNSYVIWTKLIFIFLVLGFYRYMK